MWHELDTSELEKEVYMDMPTLTRQERDDLIEFVFYQLYNAGKPSNPASISAWFKERKLKPHPSEPEILSTLKNKEAPV
jgi:hypothetical protein